MKPSYAKPENAKYLKFIVVVFFLIFLFIIFKLSFLNPKTVETNSCYADLKRFDELVDQSKLPIIENPNALCHGMNMSTDFSKLQHRWAVAKFIGIKLDSNYTLQFQGVNNTEEIRIPLTQQEAGELKIDEYYKIDMNNICRYFFMMVDSRSPSPLLNTFVKPVHISCK